MSNKRVVMRIKDVSQYYENLHVLSNLNLEVMENEFIVIIGPSGCGKTTLVNILSGQIRPTSGTIYHNDQKVIFPHQSRGVVFQADAVFPWLTVQQNVEFGLKVRKIPAAKRKDIALKHIEMVGLKGYENMWPKQLSGGMRKRVDVARVFANDPQILLMDEPFGSLDAQTKEMLQMALLDLLEKEKKTVVFITHDIEEAIFLADRVVVMSCKPGVFHSITEVPFGRPRVSNIKMSTEFQTLRSELTEAIRKVASL